MSTSGTTQCARCGGAVDAEGRCSICGDTLSSEIIETGSDSPTGKTLPANPSLHAIPGGRLVEATDHKKNSKGEKTALLINNITNERYPLNQSVSKIGRDQTNNISITQDHYISRHHAWVLQMQGGYWVEDLGSTNGSLLNGEILTERKQIFPGDRITFGKTELVFVVE
jgi:hypothetical protein